MAKRRPESPLCHLLDRTLSWACWGRGSALLGLRDKEAILGHPVAGQTWETLVVETLLAAAPERSDWWRLPMNCGR